MNEAQGAWHGVTPYEFDQLASEFGTPFYLYDADDITSRIRVLREVFEEEARVYYAVKANPNLELLRTIRGAADGVDISSSGELEQALSAGFDPNTISFAGPAKSDAELEAAIRAGIGGISVESEREIRTATRIAEEHGLQANIVLRVNPLMPNKFYGLKMGGRPVQFGIDEEHLPEAERLVLRHEQHVRFRGIHVYAGSQCFESEGVLEGARNTLRIAREIEERSGLRCRTINLGGGFGIAHNGGRELDPRPLAEGLVPLLRGYRDKSEDLQFVFELGRYLTADAGIYVTSVIGSKNSRGKTFFVCDGGLHHHLAAAGSFGAALRTNYDLRNLSRPMAEEITCNIAGPSCNPTDLLGVEVSVQRPEDGDLLGVLRSGSYGFTASPLLFLGRPTPAEIVRYKGEFRLGRRSREMSEFN